MDEVLDGYQQLRSQLWSASLVDFESHVATNGTTLPRVGQAREAECGRNLGPAAEIKGFAFSEWLGSALRWRSSRCHTAARAPRWSYKLIRKADPALRIDGKNCASVAPEKSGRAHTLSGWRQRGGAAQHERPQRNSRAPRHRERQQDANSSPRCPLVALHEWRPARLHGRPPIIESLFARLRVAQAVLRPWNGVETLLFDRTAVDHTLAIRAVVNSLERVSDL